MTLLRVHRNALSPYMGRSHTHICALYAPTLEATNRLHAIADNGFPSARAARFCARIARVIWTCPILWTDKATFLRLWREACMNMQRTQLLVKNALITDNWVIHVAKARLPPLNATIRRGILSDQRSATCGDASSRQLEQELGLSTYLARQWGPGMRQAWQECGCAGGDSRRHGCGRGSYTGSPATTQPLICPHKGKRPYNAVYVVSVCKC